MANRPLVKLLDCSVLCEPGAGSIAIANWELKPSRANRPKSIKMHLVSANDSRKLIRANRRELRLQIGDLLRLHQYVLDTTNLQAPKA